VSQDFSKRVAEGVAPMVAGTQPTFGGGVVNEGACKAQEALMGTDLISDESLWAVDAAESIVDAPSDPRAGGARIRHRPYEVSTRAVPDDPRAVRPARGRLAWATRQGFGLPTRRPSGTNPRQSVRLIAAAAAVAMAGLGGSLIGARPAHADDIRHQSWYLGQLKVANVQKMTQGEGMVVAVIDSGVDATHPDLRGNVLPGIDVNDPANAHKGQQDNNGHGTAMAAYIAGHGHGSGGGDGILGVAPKAKILPLDIYDSSGKHVVQGSINKAIQLATDKGADVICIAITGSFQPGEQDVVHYAATHNVVVVAAAGNPPDPLVADPAALPEALAVTSVDRNRKVATTVRGLPDRTVDIAAPGADLPAAIPGSRYATADGTSVSTAIVSGALALVRAKHPDEAYAQQVQRVAWTASDLGDPGFDNTYGWGELNLVDAVSGTPHPPATAAAARATASRGTAVALPPLSSSDNTQTDLLGLAILIVGVLVVAAIVVGIILLVRRRGRTAA
jgi:subtilisin family serine protease